MGNQCQRISVETTNVNVVLDTNTEITNQGNVQFQQEFDNPQHHLIRSKLLGLQHYRPNDLNSIQNKENLSVYTPSSRRFSLVKIDSLDLDNEYEPHYQLNDMIKQSVKNYKAQKRYSVNYSPSEVKLQSVNYLSLEDQSSSKAIDIKPESFIHIKHADIEKFYQFLGKIGQGSYGSVMKALCLRTNQLRAIKILKRQPQKRKQKRNPQGSLKQLNILRQLDHPNIIKLYQVYFYNDSYYLVTEFCEGGSILDYLRQNKQYSQNIVKTIIKQLLSALAYLHSSKIAHRDIKLENIVFIKKVNSKSKKQDVEIKIIDFGQSLELKYSHNNKDKRQVGTITYMAPQVLQGLYSEKCDIWSCGVILWMLLSGRNPFKRGSKKQTLELIRSKVIQFRDDLWNNVSPNLKSLIKQMLERNPLKRISARQALKNSWFSEEIQGVSSQKMNEIVKKLYNYYRQNHLVSVIESYLTFLKITQQERSQITRLFRKLDHNLSGSIDLDQLKEDLAMCTQNQNDQEIEFVLQKIRMNKNKRIDFNQFITAFYDRKQIYHQSSLQLAFHYFDADQNGYIDKKQLRTILKGCKKDQVNQILHEIDKNGDEKISKEQFISYLKLQKFL